MKKLFSIFVLTLFFAGSINAVNLNDNIENSEVIQLSPCEESAWDLADFIYEFSGGDGFYAGAVLQSALELCE